MNFIDKVIAAVNPVAAVKRAAARESMRKYEAGAKTRRTSTMQGSGSSINQDTLRDGGQLRQSARHLEQNNDYAKKALRTIKLNVVGSGIRPAFAGKGRNIKNLKAEFDKWANSTEADFEGKQTFYGLQGSVMYNVALSGSVLVLKRRTPANTIPLQIQLLEPEYLDTTKDKDELSNGGYIQHGIEFDKEGRRVGYWLYDRHPAESTKAKSRLVKASEVEHIYLKERPGQNTGVPFLHTSAISLNDLADYKDAQLLRQKIAACFTAFVSDTDSTGDPNATAQLMESYGRVEPGMIKKLNPGETVTFGTPPAAEGFAEFSKGTLQGISAGIGISYEMLTNDYSNVNFSSGRMGWIEAQRFIEDLQENLLIPQFCAKVWGWFLEGFGLRMGKATNITVTWTSPRREMIDPVKETKALLEQVRGGLLPWQEAVRQMGYDPDEVAIAYQADLQLFDKLGIKVSSDFRTELLRYAKQGEAPEKPADTK